MRYIILLLSLAMQWSVVNKFHAYYLFPFLEEWYVPTYADTHTFYYSL